VNAIDHLDAADAALYALGCLDDRARHAIDQHAAGCDACSRLLGTAESDVAVLAAAEPAYPLPERLARAPWPARVRTAAWPAWAALAAALALALVPSAFFWRQNQAMHAGMTADSAAMDRLAASDFRTAPFRGMSPGSAARVMYAPDGSWYVVLVRGASRALQVAWMHDGRRTMLGAAHLHGEVAMLYLPKSHRMDRLALLDGERVVAEAQLAY